MSVSKPVGRESRGGRGARERILSTTAELFARDGIHATGIAKLTQAAHVSTRTLYQHFPSKDALVDAYLERIKADADGPIGIEAVLDREDLSPRERLVALFDIPPTSAEPGGVVRGCPLHNTVVEAAGAMPVAAAFVHRHKSEFAARLIATAEKAGARDPESLGRHLSLVFEGARALSASRNDQSAFEDARVLAALLIDQALQ